jgi:hypothetical protein
MEWLKDADLTLSSNAPVMNGATATTHDTSAYKMGIFTGTFKFLQPLGGASVSGTTSWPAVSTAGGHAYTNMQTFTDQTMWYPGSPGNVVWTPNKAGVMAN